MKLQKYISILFALSLTTLHAQTTLPETTPEKTHIPLKLSKIEVINESTVFNFTVSIRAYKKENDQFVPSEVRLGKIAFDDTRIFEALTLLDNTVLTLEMGQSDYSECGSVPLDLRGKNYCISSHNGACLHASTAYEIIYHPQAKEDEVALTIKIHPNPCGHESSATTLQNPFKFLKFWN